MTDAAPKRIWVSAPNEDNEVETWTDPDEGGTEYILASELATLRAQVERLTGALRFYADFHENPNDGPWGINSQDFGKEARAALTRLRADAAAMDDAVAHYPHPGYGKPYPITTVLRDLASQEGCDGEPYDAMMFAAKTIDDMRAAGHGTSVWAGSARMASLLIRGGDGDGAADGRPVGRMGV